MNMSLVRLLACPILAFLCAGSSYSQEIKIGFISVERTVRDAPVSILAGRRMETGGALTDTQRRFKESRLIELDLLLQRRQRELQEDIQARQNEAIAATLTKGNEAINQVAERERLDWVIQDAAWVSTGVDLTGQVIKILADGT